MITLSGASPLLFAQISYRFYSPQVDLFASRLNRPVDAFVCWKPEPEAWAIDAFSINWRNIKFYAFPPFSILSRVQNLERQSLWHTGDAPRAYPTMVPCDAQSINRSPSTYQARFEEPGDKGKSSPLASTPQKIVSFSDSFVDALW